MSLFDGDLSVALSRITKSFGGSSSDIAAVTRNSKPFVTEHKYPDLVDTVYRIIDSRDCVRSSSYFGEKMKEIIEGCLVAVSGCMTLLGTLQEDTIMMKRQSLPFIRLKFDSSTSCYCILFWYIIILLSCNVDINPTRLYSAPGELLEHAKCEDPPGCRDEAHYSLRSHSTPV